MKANKKLLVVLGSIVAVMAIVAGSVLGTVAYMTSASKVSNVFTVGNVKITLDEGKVNADGQLVDGGVTRTDNNSYKLIPGKSYDKDPRITVQADTEYCYLFLVTRNQITSIEASAEEAIAGKPTMAQQMVANGWGIYKDTTAGTRVWIYCGQTAGAIDADKNAVSPKAICGTGVNATDGVTTIPVFSNFYITSEATDTLEMYRGAEVTINAVGIQADSFGTFGSSAAVDAAWAAVVNQFPYIQDNVGNNNGQS